MYADGHGVPQDFTQAYVWFSLVVSGLPDGEKRENAAKRRDAMAGKMTSEQVRAAQKLAADRKPK